jgi:hypothetical protein
MFTSGKVPNKVFFNFDFEHPQDMRLLKGNRYVTVAMGAAFEF